MPLARWSEQVQNVDTLAKCSVISQGSYWGLFQVGSLLHPFVDILNAFNHGIFFAQFLEAVIM